MPLLIAAFTKDFAIFQQDNDALFTKSHLLDVKVILVPTKIFSISRDVQFVFLGHKLRLKLRFKQYILQICHCHVQQSGATACTRVDL
jgi:hypothetical protein